MTYEHRLLQTYRDIIEDMAERVVSRLVRKCIRELQAIKEDSGMLMTQDGLKNLWDEFCVQAQGEQSVFWDLYEDYVHDVAYRLTTETCSQTELKLIWLHSEEFEEWSDCEFEDEENLGRFFDEQGFPDAFNVDGAVDHIYSSILGEACDYHNNRIDTFLSLFWEP